MDWKLPEWWDCDKPYKIGNALSLIKGIPNNSIDLVLTDPPFGINKKGVINDDTLDLYYQILPDLYRILKDNTFFVTFFSIGRLPDAFSNNPFSYKWCGVIYYPNMERICHCPIGRSVQSMFLLFEKGNATHKKHIRDVLRYVYPGKDKFPNHPAPKPYPAIVKLIECLSKPNAIVFDPFVGSGTTIRASRNTDRIGLGIEINPEYEMVIQDRIMEAIPQIETYGNDMGAFMHRVKPDSL